MKVAAKIIVSILTILALFLYPLITNTPDQIVKAAAIIYVDASATGAHDGTSWQDAFTSLQSALAVAVADDEIWVAAGTYTPGNNRSATFQLISGVEIYGGFPVGGGDFDSRDPELNPTILSGDIGTPANNADNSYHVIDGSGTDPNTILDGLTIAYGNANSNYPNERGGGLYIADGNLWINNSIIINNEASIGGGVFSSDSSPIFINSAFISNIATSAFGTGEKGGGGVYANGGNPSFINTTFTENSVNCTNSVCGGGGLYNFTSNSTILNSVFNGNTVSGSQWYSGGGGIYNYNSNLLIGNSMFTSNSLYLDGYESGGGAIYHRNGQSQIINLIFFDNFAWDEGSAMFNGGGSVPLVANCIFWENGTPNNQIRYENNPPIVRYSIVQGGYSGTGNLDVDPRFVSPENNDFRLNYISPAIDAGDNTSVFDDYLDLDNDGIIDEPTPIDIDGKERFFEMPIQPNVGNGDFPLVDIGTYEVYNSAPVLDNSGDTHLVPILEDDINNPGTTINDLIASGANGDPINDADPDPQEGIAIIGVDDEDGSWQYSIDDGNSWYSFGNPSDDSAVLLGDDPTDRVRFAPNPNFNGIVTDGLTFRAWDRSDGYPSGASGIDLFILGGASPYSSETESASVTVESVNDHPVLDPISNQTINEDSGESSLIITGIGSGDPGETQTITVTTSSNNPGLLPAPFVEYFPPSTTATLYYTPTSDAFGTATISVEVMDDGGTENGGSDTFSRTFQIIVNAVNDEPYFDKGPDPVVFEDSGATSIPGWATNISAGPPNESSQNLTFVLTPDNPALFSGPLTINSQTGTLSFTPALNAVGSTPVTVDLIDDGGTANGGDDTYTDIFTISIDPVNDPPSFTPGSDPEVLEDAGYQTLSGWASAISPGPPDEYHQALTLNLTPDNPSLFSTLPAIDPDTGNLSFTLAEDANGNTTVEAELKDDGGTANGGSDTYTTTFEISVQSVNDPPSVVLGSNPVVNEDSGSKTLPSWATNISPGPTDEAGQSLTFSLTAVNPSLFSSQPVIQSSTGNLSFTPAPNANGSSTVSVVLKDNGGTANGGSDTSTFSFTITVNAVNDKPSVSGFSKQGLWNQALNLTSSEFTGHFSDVDGDALDKVKITSLPLHGTLRYDGALVSIGQEIPHDNLSKLSFQPDQGWEGTTIVKWNGSDGREYATTDAVIDLTISSVIIPPVTSKLFIPLITRNQQVNPPPPTPTPSPTPSPTPTPTPTPTPPPTWVNIVTEDFEGSFPGSWQLLDDYGAGEYFWNKRSCRKYAGSNSGWAVGGGNNGGSLSCGSDYPDDASSWMTYGPFSLEGATAALVNYKLWLYSEYEYDKFCMFASLNDVNYYGTCYWGDSDGWIDRSFDLSNVYILGNLLGKSQVWISFYFYSDYLLNYAEGAYVDNIVFRKCMATSGCGNMTASSNPKLNEGKFFERNGYISKK
jgi:hypothetical protein